MTDIAIDVVILPPAEVSAEVIDLNRELCREDRRIELDEVAVLPHISLFMASMSTAQLAEAMSQLDALLAHHTALPLTVTGVSYGGFDAKHTVSSLALAPAPALLQLHREICDTLAGLRALQTTPEQFADADEVDANSRQYVHEFLNEHAYEAFDPHITVGFGRLQRHPTVGDFTAARVAVCQLGPYCTCRRILHQFDLAPRR